MLIQLISSSHLACMRKQSFIVRRTVRVILHGPEESANLQTFQVRVDVFECQSKKGQMAIPLEAQLYTMVGYLHYAVVYSCTPFNKWVCIFPRQFNLKNTGIPANLINMKVPLAPINLPCSTMPGFDHGQVPLRPNNLPCSTMHTCSQNVQACSKI